LESFVHVCLCVCLFVQSVHASARTEKIAQCSVIFKNVCQLA
jgi:hypothetical protein